MSRADFADFSAAAKWPSAISSYAALTFAEERCGCHAPHAHATAATTTDRGSRYA